VCVDWTLREPLIFGFHRSFLDFNYLVFPDFVSNATASLKGMADACSDHGFGLQVWMCLMIHESFV
jgi:hypothetical protein